MGALADYVQKLWGVKTRSKEDPLITQATTTRAKAFKNNPDRFMALISNLGSSVIYVGFDNRVSATRGIRIDANGGSIVFRADIDGELVGHEIWVVGAGTTALKTLEVEAA